MDDLIRKSALLSDIKESIVFSGRSGETSAEIRGAHKVVDRIKAAPTVDAVEVVRCKDCKHFNCDRYDFLGECTNQRIARNNNGDIYPQRDFFCSYGERKSE